MGWYSFGFEMKIDVVYVPEDDRIDLVESGDSYFDEYGEHHFLWKINYTTNRLSFYKAYVVGEL
jgi:hypothetical protein